MIRDPLDFTTPKPPQAAQQDPEEAPRKRGRPPGAPAGNRRGRKPGSKNRPRALPTSIFGVEREIPQILRQECLENPIEFDAEGRGILVNLTRFTPGTLLRLARTLRGLSQTDLAAILGASSPTISNLESGIRTLSESDCREICDSLGVHFDSFWKLYRG